MANLNAQNIKTHLKLTDQTFPLMKKYAGIADGRGKDHSQPCPFCGGTDRCWYSNDNEMFFCRDPDKVDCPARKGVDVFALVQREQGVSFTEALVLIARESGYEAASGQETMPTFPESVDGSDKPVDGQQLKKSRTPKQQKIYVVSASDTCVSVADLLQKNISLYMKCGVNTPCGTSTIGQVLVSFRVGGMFDEQIDTVRSEPDRDKRKKLKKNLLPCVVFGSEPQTLRQAEFCTQNGILSVDVDHIPLDELQAVKAAITELSYVFAVALSVSGDGLFALVAYEGVPDLKKLLAALQADFPYPLDTACSDVTRLRFFTLDPSIIVKDTVFPAILTGQMVPVDLYDEYKPKAEQTKNSQGRNVESVDGQDTVPTRIIITDCSTVEITEPKWLLANTIPKHEITIISGPGAVGKTYLTCYFASLSTKGHSWNGVPCEKGCVLFFAGEGKTDRFVARLKNNGADLNLCGILEGKEIYDKKSKQWFLDPIVFQDRDAIERAIDEWAEKTGLPVQFVVADPIGNFVGDAKIGRDAEVRRFLTPLQQIAEKKDIAIILVAHHGKASHSQSQHQVLESVGFVNTARSVWQIYRDKEDKDLRYFAPSKTNDCIDPKTVSYRIVPPQGEVQIVDTDIDKNADDFMNEDRRNSGAGRKNTKLVQCISWLAQLLKGGDRLQSEIMKLAKEMEFGKSTVNAAKRELEIESIRESKNDPWQWHFPSDAEIEIEDAD